MKKIIVLGTILSLILLTSISFGQFSKVWTGGIGGAGTDPPNLIRAWGVVAGFDLDGDGNKEFATFDGTAKRIYVWEYQGVDGEYDLVWYMDKEVGGVSILNGGERSLMITDLDNDGHKELIQVWDSFHPDSTDGFEALEIYEHDPTSGEFLPDEPTATYDPPRNEAALVRLEFQSQALDVDGDGVVELILTHRGGKDIFLSILSMPGADFTNPGWVVEYIDSAASRYGLKVHSMTVGDVDGDGNNDMLVQMDGDKKPIMVYSVTGANSYTATEFDSSVYHLDYMGSAGKLAIADFDGDGNNEVYVGARGGKVWVVNEITSAATAFRRDNFYLIEDINALEGCPPGKPELRGGITGDADNDGLPNFYITGRDPVEAVYDFEWVGGTGDVDDPDNYVMSVIFREDNTDEITVGFVAIAIGDLDGDGADHQDVVFTTGNGNEGTMPGIYMIEWDATTGIFEPSTSIPGSFILSQNYPNPFNPITEILYELPRASRVTLDVYNVLGQKVNTLVKDKLQEIGTYRVSWDATDNRGAMVTSGVYFYKIETGDFRATKKMVLLR